MNFKKSLGLALVCLLVSFFIGCEKSKNKNVAFVNLFDIYCFAPYEKFEGKEVTIMNIAAENVELDSEKDELLFQGVFYDAYFYPSEHRHIGPTGFSFKNMNREFAIALPNYWKTLMIIKSPSEDIHKIEVYHRSLKTNKFRISSETVQKAGTKGFETIREKVYEYKDE